MKNCGDLITTGRRGSALLFACALSLADPAAAQQRPIFFIQATFDPFYAKEHGGSTVPARGAGFTARPVAGLTGQLPGDARLTVLGGASATRYAVTPTSDADSLFAMADLSKTIEGFRWGASMLAANSRDPTFATGVAKTYDIALSLSRAFNPDALEGWSLTPRLKATRRLADAAIVERWDLGASIELARPVLGGTFTFGAGYDWLDYSVDGRHDDKISLSSTWFIDLNENVQVGLRSDVSFAKSNIPGKSVNSFEIGPTLRVLFAH
jgi:hypothetical protein